MTHDTAQTSARPVRPSRAGAVLESRPLWTSLQAGCKVLLLSPIFLLAFRKSHILVCIKRPASLSGILELLNDENNYTVKGHLQPLCHQWETLPCAHRGDGHASLWVWHLAWNVTNPHDVLKLPLQLSWKMVKNPTRAADSLLAGHLRMLRGTVTGAQDGSNGAVFLSSGLLGRIYAHG